MNDDAGITPLEGTAYMQTAYLVELLLNDEPGQVRDLLLALPIEQVGPLLGAALIFGAEAMKDNFGVEGALEQIALVRQQVGMRGAPDKG